MDTGNTLQDVYANNYSMFLPFLDRPYRLMFSDRLPVITLDTMRCTMSSCVLQSASGTSLMARISSLTQSWHMSAAPPALTVSTITGLPSLPPRTVKPNPFSLLGRWFIHIFISSNNVLFPSLLGSSLLVLGELSD